jgi:hypothetical protein
MARARFRTLALPLTLAGVVLVVVGLLGDADLLLQVGAALAICLLPSLVLSLRWRPVRTPIEHLATVVRAMGWRMGVGLAASLLLVLNWPELFREVFWITLVAGYQVVLGVETWVSYHESPPAEHKAE